MYDKKDLYKKEGELLNKFYDHHCGRYFIYFDEIDSEEIIKGVLHQLMNGYVMSVADDGTGGKMYVLFSVEIDTDGVSEIYSCGVTLYNLLQKKGSHYFTEVSFKEYQNSKMYQDAIDYVLEQACFESNYVDGWSLAMFVNNEGKFQFVEVLNACE